MALQPRENPSAAQEVLDYLFERLRSQYSEAGYPAELFDAVRATGSHEVIDFDQRLAATASFLKRSESEALAAANKRIANILKKSSDTDSKQAVDSTLLTLPAEKALHQALQEAEPVVAAALHNRDYAEALEHLATLRPAIDAFFADVMVNDPDPALRANRLALVSRIRQAFMGVADLSYLPG